MRRCCATIWVALLLAAPAWSAEPAGLKLQSVKKIWDQAPHNAFTDLIRFQDRWYCTFREATGHAAGAGAIRVLTSSDGDKWESAAHIQQKDIDLRDPKLSIMPDGRLMIVGAAAVPSTRNPLTDHYSVVSFSKDAKEWSEPKRVSDSWQWLWRVTWNQGTAFGVTYEWDPKAPASKENRRAFLCRSRDGLKFDHVVNFKVPNANEATLRFDGDVAYCLQRCDGSPAQLGSSKPPYNDWTWKDLGRFVGGPNFIRLPDGGWWACGRLIEGGKPQTVLCRLDLKEGKLIPAITLPSGGDTSYAGMVWHDDKLWISYYSSHEGKTSIYLAVLGK